MRGFEKINKYKDDSNINIPVRKTKYSAGYDLEAAVKIQIEAQSTKLIPTGIKAYMQKDEVLKIYIRSSLAYKKNLTLANGVGIIDCDYYNNVDNEGHIMVLVKNNSNDTVVVDKQERIAQGIFVKYLCADSEEITNERVGGFGSTGEK